MQTHPHLTRFTALALGVAGALAFGQAHASAFLLKENSVKAQGRAMAGAASAKGDASVVVNNPAVMSTFTERTPEAYERLLLDVIRGNQTLFMRRDELEAAWQWVDPIREAWDGSTDAPQGYTAGTWGPSGAVALIERDGRTWHEDEN